MTNIVTFPGLGLEFALNRVAFTIPILDRPVYWYGVIIASGLLLAVYLCMRWAPRFGIVPDHIIDLMLFAVPVALVAIRAYYVIFNLGLYRREDGSLDWAAILRYSDGGLAIYGAIISSAIVLLIFCKVRKVNFLAFADLGVHGLFIGQLIGRWGNFMNREAFGAQTDSFLRMGLTDASGATIYVHPTFLYESVWNAIGLLILHFYSKRRKFDGQIFLMYLGWYGLGRMFIEGLRTDSLYVGSSNLRVSQLLAGICFLAVVIFLVYDKIFREHDPRDLYVNQVAQRKAAEAVEATEAAAEETASEVEEAAENAAEDAEDEETVEAEEAAETEAEAAPEDASDEDTEA
mgnify:CR=1 FL=1